MEKMKVTQRKRNTENNDFPLFQDTDTTSLTQWVLNEFTSNALDLGILFLGILDLPWVTYLGLGLVMEKATCLSKCLLLLCHA